MISLNVIVATDKNGMISKCGEIPWKCSADLKHFKEMTMGCPIVMGRKTFKSLPKVLEGRNHYVITRNKFLIMSGEDNVSFFEDYRTAIDCALDRGMAKDKDVFVVGGAQIYNEALNGKLSFAIDKVFISIIDVEIEPDGTSLYFNFDKKNYELKNETQKEGFLLQEWHQTNRSN